MQRLADAVVWQDNEVRIDVSKSDLALRRGEVMIDTLSSVEDSKGASGVRGDLSVTNLRIIWVSHRTSRVNISVGINCISPGRGLALRSATSKTRGNLQSLYVAADFQGVKFEFIFTSLVRASPRLFTTVMNVQKYVEIRARCSCVRAFFIHNPPTLPSRSYESSKIYRELKLRSAIFRIEDKSLVLLPRERTFTKLSCWNLASESGSLGEAVVTSQRIAWRASFAENFNVSIPYVAMKSVNVRNNPKFGATLVIATTRRAGDLLFGFRVDPPEKLAALEKELLALREAAAAAPDFGVVVVVDDNTDEDTQGAGGASHRSSAPTEDVEVHDDSGEHGSGGDAYAAYLAEGPKEGDRPVIFSSELGLAIESPPPGMTLAQLWVAL